MSTWDWISLFRTEGPRLVRFLRRFGSAVSPEDVAQESFVRLYAAEPESVRSPRAFLFRTAHNLAIDQVRRRDASPVVTSEDLVQSSPAGSGSPEDERIASEEVRALEAAIASLSEQQRLALVLRRIERLPPQEIAARLGVSVRQAQRLVVQALANVQAHLRAQRDRSGDGG